MYNILKSTKLVYTCFYNEDGHIQSEVSGKIKRMNLAEPSVAFLRGYIEFIMQSKLLNEAAVIYIKSPYDAVKSVFVAYNQQNPKEPINIKTAISNIDYNRRKLIKVFDEDMLMQIIYSSSTPDLDKYWKQLEAAMEKYSCGNIFDTKLMIRLPKTVSPVEVEEERITDFMEAIGAYRIPTKKMVEESIATDYKDVISFLNYLAQCPHKSEWQEDIWEQLNDYLNGQLPILY